MNIKNVLNVEKNYVNKIAKTSPNKRYTLRPLRGLGVPCC